MRQIRPKLLADTITSIADAMTVPLLTTIQADVPAVSLRGLHACTPLLILGSQRSPVHRALAHLRILIIELGLRQSYLPKA